MAFLDFMKNRPQPQAVAKAPSAPQPTPASKDVSKAISSVDLAQFRAVGERMQKATSHQRSNHSQPGGNDGGNAALLQKQNNQDKTQAALSPTDRFNGQTALQKPRSRGWER